jgi:DNA-binding MarR family transcriptional regulator
MTQFDFVKVSSYKRCEDSPGFLLWRVSTLWRREMESVLKPLNLTHPQFVILATIGYLTQGDKRASQIQIARHASLDPNTTSQVLRSLQAKMLIKRSLLEDERSKFPLLTAQGAELLAQALPVVQTKDAQFFQTVNLEKELAFTALQKLARLE